MKKIAIFGGTGNTGQCAVEAAINTGFEVRALVRDPARLPEQLRNKVEIVCGDVLHKQDVEKTLQGIDGVVVTLGTRNDLSPTTVMSDGLSNIISAMKNNNIDVIAVCLSAFLFYDVEKVPPMFRDLNEDHQRMLNYLKDSSLKWIAVLPPHIANAPPSKHTVLYDKSPGRAISKYDLASFLVNSLLNNQHYNKICGISNVVD